MISKLHITQPRIKICEAIECYEAATEAIVVFAGKFGTINLNVCQRCAVTKFQNPPSGNMLVKESKEDDSKDG